MTNFFGMEPHDSDRILHWSDPVWFERLNQGITFEQHVAKIRDAWHVIHSGFYFHKDRRAAAKLILDKQIAHLRECERADDAAGEDL